MLAADAIDKLEPEDLIHYGLIPEFVGRLPVLGTLRALDEQALMKILTEPKNSLVSGKDGLDVIRKLLDNGQRRGLQVKAGDKILSVNDDEVPDLAGLWRRVWASGSAGAEAELLATVVDKRA